MNGGDRARQVEEFLFPISCPSPRLPVTPLQNQSFDLCSPRSWWSAGPAPTTGTCEYKHVLCGRGQEVLFPPLHKGSVYTTSDLAWGNISASDSDWLHASSERLCRKWSMWWPDSPSLPDLNNDQSPPIGWAEKMAVVSTPYILREHGGVYWWGRQGQASPSLYLTSPWGHLISLSRNLGSSVFSPRTQLPCSLTFSVMLSAL